MKIKDIINVLSSSEAIFRSGITKNNDLSDFLKEYKSLLNSIGYLTTSEFLEILKKTKDERKVKIEKKYYTFKNFTFNQIEELLQNKKTLKKELLLLAEERFGIPSGSHKKTKKEDLIEIINKAIDNEKTIAVISDNASK